MMVLFAGHFVAGRVARYFDRLQPSFLDQRLDVSVDRGNPNTWVVLLCRLENFFRGIETPDGPQRIRGPCGLRQDVYGTGYDPGSRRSADKYEAGYVPMHTTHTWRARSC